jgi:hypothetical protein
MGSGTTQHAAIPDQIIMVFITGQYERKIYVSKLTVLMESKETVSRKIVCHPPMKNIVAWGLIVQIWKDCLILPGTLEEMGRACFQRMREVGNYGNTDTYTRSLHGRMGEWTMFPLTLLIQARNMLVPSIVEYCCNP